MPLLSALDPEAARTLQLGPLWMLSALSGRAVGFAPVEREAFWDTLVGVTLRTPPGAREILVSLAEDRPGLMADFERDERSVTTGFRHVVAALQRLEATVAEDFKVALLRIGADLARLRGPYGRAMTPEDAQLLLLCAELLDLSATPVDELAKSTA